MKIHQDNYIHRDLHSGNIFSYSCDQSRIGDVGLCQQLKEKDDPDKVFGVITYQAPEVLSKEPYTKKSDIYSFGMIMWEFTNIFMIDHIILFLYRLFWMEKDLKSL